MAEPMLALTVLQPWVWAICRGGKPLENRSWKPRPELLGKRIALHAGLSKEDLINPAVRDFVVDRTPGGMTWEPDDIFLGAVVATARLGDVVTESKNRWFVGRYGWSMEDVFELPIPVRCKGALGLWRLPVDVAASVLRQEERRG